MKRWVKEVGILVMVLVVLSESEPAEAAKALIRRCAYVLIPVSVLLVKYYPDLGKQYSYWTGEAHFVGVTTSKNMLGNLCLVSGLFFLWSVFTLWKRRHDSVDKHDVFAHIVLLAMTLWLLSLSSSATSLMCLIIGIFIILVFELPFIRRNARLGANIIVLGMVLVMVLEEVFGLSEILIPNLGRDTTLTGRSEIWSEVLSMGTNPVLGTGFDSFWLGERLEIMWARHWWRPTGSHNGYLETYINLGWVGVGFLALLIISVFQKVKDELKFDYDYGRFQMAFLGLALVYNLTEAAFKGTILVWFLFLLIAVRAPAKSQGRSQVGFERTESLTTSARLMHNLP
jgi:O-antigen ligase